MNKKEVIAKLKKRSEVQNKIELLMSEETIIENALKNGFHKSGEPGIYIAWFRLINLLK